jgi:PPM family protein phosphatase
MGLQLSGQGFTHVGRRGNNEDSFCLTPELGLVVVADGMGGYEGGEEASALAVASIREFILRNTEDEDATLPRRLDPALGLTENLLSMAVWLANQQICARKRGELQRMGSTVVALLCSGTRVVLANVGDSRVYRLRGGVLTQLSRDHSLYAEMVASGMALPGRAESGFANVITRALGTTQAEPDLRAEELQPGDCFLLCTDGLFEALSDADLAALLGAGPTDEAGQRLVEEAFRRGSKDNITAVVVRVEAL